MSGLGLRTGNGEAGAGLVFPTVPELIATARVPTPLRSSPTSHVDPVDLPRAGGGGNQCPLPTRQALRPPGPSRTIMFLSYALRRASDTNRGLSLRDQAAHAHPATPTLRTEAPPPHSLGTSPQRQLHPDTQFHKRSLKSAHPAEHTDPHEDTPF